MMGARLFILCLAVLPSCTTVEHHGFKLSSFAGDIKDLRTPEGLVIGEINNSRGAQIGREAAADIASAYAMGKAFDALGNLIDAGADALKDGNDTDKAINANNNATKVEVETFVPPEPVLQ